MADTSTVDKLRGLVLSAVELREMIDWPEALIEDYLNLISNLESKHQEYLKTSEEEPAKRHSMYICYTVED